MPSPFDTLKRTAFDHVTRVMGVSLSWSGQEAKVLFNAPTEEQKRQGAEYEDVMAFIEYPKPLLAGLYEATRERNPVPEVVVNSATYYCRSAELDVDGDTIKIYIERAE